MCRLGMCDDLRHKICVIFLSIMQRYGWSRRFRGECGGNATTPGLVAALIAAQGKLCGAPLKNLNPVQQRHQALCASVFVSVRSATVRRSCRQPHWPRDFCTCRCFPFPSHRLTRRRPQNFPFVLALLHPQMYISGVNY